MSSSLSALATLKPQAGLIVPQAVPSSQPSVVVSVVPPHPPPRNYLPAARLCVVAHVALPLQVSVACRASLTVTFLFRVQASQWIWVSWWE